MGEKMNELKMAACGLDCSECNQYKVTTQHDAKAAESLVVWYRSMGWIGESEGAEAVMKKAPLCKGCWNSTEDCFFKCGCANIDFRVCCKERQIDHCGQCGDFPCEHYKTWGYWHESHEKAMEHLMSLRTNP